MERQLPYAVDEVAGAEHLVVAFPKLRPGGAMPPAEVIRQEAERLDVPMDNVIVTGTSMGAVCALLAKAMAEHPTIECILVEREYRSSLSPAERPALREGDAELARGPRAVVDDPVR